MAIVILPYLQKSLNKYKSFIIFLFARRNNRDRHQKIWHLFIVMKRLIGSARFSIFLISNEVSYIRN